MLLDAATATSKVPEAARKRSIVLLLFKVRHQVHLQAESTAQSANREKSSKLVFKLDETDSPVDLGCRIPAKCAKRLYVEQSGFEPSVPIRPLCFRVGPSALTARVVETTDMKLVAETTLRYRFALGWLH